MVGGLPRSEAREKSSLSLREKKPGVQRPQRISLQLHTEHHGVHEASARSPQWLGDYSECGEDRCSPTGKGPNLESQSVKTRGFSANCEINSEGFHKGYSINTEKFLTAYGGKARPQSFAAMMIG